MGHDHRHGPEPRAGARFRNRLLIAFLLAGTFMLVEFGTALATRSLTLLSDAGHMLTDTVGLGLALAAISAATTASAATTWSSGARSSHCSTRAHRPS